MIDNAKKGAILKAAEKRFVRHGLHKTTIEEIARDLRIAKGGIYYYFKTKEDIYYEVVKLQFMNHLNDIINVINSNNNLDEQIYKYLELKFNLKTTNYLIYNLYASMYMEFKVEHEVELFKHYIKSEKELLKKFISTKIKLKPKTLDSYLDFVLSTAWNFVTSKEIFDIADSFDTIKHIEYFAKGLHDRILQYETA